MRKRAKEERARASAREGGAKTRASGDEGRPTTTTTTITTTITTTRRATARGQKWPFRNRRRFYAHTTRHRTRREKWARTNERTSARGRRDNRTHTYPDYNDNDNDNDHDHNDQGTAQASVWYNREWQRCAQRERMRKQAKQQSGVRVAHLSMQQATRREEGGREEREGGRREGERGREEGQREGGRERKRTNGGR